MFTQCPTCRTVYEISAKDLTIAQGKVRCGFCSTTFNALESLTEDAPAHGTTLTGITVPGPIVETVDGEDHGNDAEPAHAELVLAVTPAPSASEAASFAALAQAFVEPESVPAAPAAWDDADLHRIAAAAPAVAAGAGADPALEAMVGDADPALARELQALIRPPRSPWAHAGWSLAALLLLALLGAQLVHHWRGELVLQPALAPALSRVYAALGIELDPHWDVNRYVIVQHPEMSAERDDDHAELRLTATIANDAPRPQPFPVLRLTLEDRWGAAIAARDFSPREYLRVAHDDAALLAPGEQARADVLVVDPGVDTVGFTLDICLADATGAMHCANDAS